MENYKSIYCRAKSIMSKEEDVLALVKEVSSLAEKSNVAAERLEAWMIKQTYVLGCGKFRKKKAREAELIELQEQEYVMQEGIDSEKTKELICDTLAELPDLYHATLMAFYYDQYSVTEVAAVTGYSEGVVINRLNYVHKYLSRKLEDYKEEQKVNVQFSVELVYEALKQWVEENAPEEGDVPIEVKANLDAVKEELLSHSVKTGMDKKQVVTIAGIVGGLALLALVAILIMGELNNKEDNHNNQPTVGEDDVEVDSTEDATEDLTDDLVDDVPEDNQETSSPEYILPNSDSVKLTRADLQGLSKEELRLARNEIFARHGMVFGVPDLDAYFGEKSWYKPTVAYDDFYDKVEMNEIEEANLSLILSVEEMME